MTTNNHSIHRPFVWITGAFSLGIILNQLVNIPFVTVCSLALAALAAGLVTSGRRYMPTICLIFAMAGLGVVYAHSRHCTSQKDIVHVAQYYRNKPITVRGMIVSDQQVRHAINGVKTIFTLDVDAVKTGWGWQKRNGTILAHVYRPLDVFYGDVIELEGKLHRPYDFSSDTNFSYRAYLEHYNIRYLLSVKKDTDILTLGRGQGSRLKYHSLKLRCALIKILDQYLSGNESGIMKAVLLGDRSAIAKPLRVLFVQTGTAHILAISGLHIGVVAALFVLVVKLFPVGRKAQLILAILALAGYAFLTGGRPSVMRATIMMIVFLSSLIIENEPDALNTLSFSAMIILVYNPMNLFDIGFQLSFLCVFSMLQYQFMPGISKAPRQTDYRAKRKLNFIDRCSKWAAHSLGLSLAIWIGVAGFIAYYFGIITPVTVFANLFIVPFTSVIVLLGFGLMIVGLTVPAWAVPVAVCLKVALNVMVGLIFLCDKIPFAYFYIKDVTIWHIAGYYIILLSVMFVPFKPYCRALADFFLGIFRTGRIDKHSRV